MTREDIRAIFPEANEEQVTAMLNANNTEVNEAKTKHKGTEGGPTASDLQAEKKRGDDLEKELNELKNANAVRQIREKVAGEKKIPANLLTGDTEELCNAQADAILAFAQPEGYPVVKDGGDPSKTPTSSTGKQFAEWAKQLI